MSGPEPPPPEFRRGLRTVAVGAGLAAVGVGTEAATGAWFWYAERFETGTSFESTAYVVTRVLIGAALIAVALRLRHRARQRRDGARTGLAVLMFCCAAIAVAAVLPTLLGFYATHLIAWRVGAVPLWVTAGWAVSLATLPVLALLGLVAGRYLTTSASRRHTAHLGETPPDESRRRRPAAYQGALDAVAIGMVVALVNLVADGLAAGWSWRYATYWLATSSVMPLYLVVRGVLGIALLVATVRLWRRADRGEPAGRTGLATLMLCSAVLMFPSMVATGILMLPAGSTGYHGSVAPPAWLMPAVYTSLTTAAALLLTGWLAGTLLMLPASRRYTSEAFDTSASSDRSVPLN